jgi:hypothetical protein
LRYRQFSPTNLQPHKSGLLISPLLAWLLLPQCPDQQSFLLSLGLSSLSRLTVSTCSRFCRLC